MCKHLPLALYTKFTPCKIIQKCFFFVLAKLKNGSGTTVTETWVSITDFCIRLLIFFKRFLDRKSKKDLRVLEFAFALKIGSFVGNYPDRGLFCRITCSVRSSMRRLLGTLCVLKEVRCPKEEDSAQ